MSYLIQPVKVNGTDSWCFTEGNTSHLSRPWRTDVVLSGNASVYNSEIDRWALVPSIDTPGIYTGSVEFAIACGVKEIDFLINFDLDGIDAYAKIYQNDILIGGAVSRNDAGQPRYWTANGFGSDGALIRIVANNLQPSACGSIIKIEGLMQNDLGGNTYLNVRVDDVRTESSILYATSDGVDDKLINADCSSLGLVTYYIDGLVRPSGKEVTLQYADNYGITLTGLIAGEWQYFRVDNTEVVPSNIVLGYNTTNGTYTNADWRNIKLKNSFTDNTLAYWPLSEQIYQEVPFIANYYNTDLNNITAIDISGNDFHGVHIGGQSGRDL